MERKVIYFEKPGKDNTEACLQIAKNAIRDSNYKHIVIASTEGDTGLLFSEALKNFDINIVVVTHSAGFKAANTHEMPLEIRKKIEATGAKVYTGTMITHNIETAFASKFSGLYPTLIVSQSLRRYGEGPKVCCEIAMMAADAGLIPEGEEILAVAGTAKGADSVLVIRSATSKRFLELRVLEILAKPR
ncbi:hypothetical protein JZK55_10830 [Dissulfurispira thermophila]|uniref:Pyruvate kinase C-terminal domain-containing protein n=2 Tax=root TaxID=1 RepID=A0A7G1H230_9BACT|nr:pyruvate kinase alpha/beta domain-containing protein [Dissulfurispira thermophila]BCB96161.1 hypothetical protein JZK55_10830 [Dissulfurispira thermophila]